MARFSSASIAFLLLAMAAFGVDVSYAGAAGSLLPGDCENACKYRCSEILYNMPCRFACKRCCTACLCVPSGTSGNRDECPCYDDMRTKEGKPRCP